MFSKLLKLPLKGLLLWLAARAEDHGAAAEDTTDEGADGPVGDEGPEHIRGQGRVGDGVQV